jgi:membrane protease YdiL (CAAX protease family)
LLAILFEYSRSLWPSVLLHALNNTARLALLYILFISGFISGI